MEEKKQDTAKENRNQEAREENGAGQASEASRRGRSRRQPPEERKKNGSVRPKIFAALGGSCGFGCRFWRAFSFTVRCRSMRNASFLAP